jgi:hypothetical protein
MKMAGGSRRPKKADGSTLLVDLPGNMGPKQSIDTPPPQYTEDAAVKSAVDAIDGGSIR